MHWYVVVLENLENGQKKFQVHNFLENWGILKKALENLENWNFWIYYPLWDIFVFHNGYFSDGFVQYELLLVREPETNNFNYILIIYFIVWIWFEVDKWVIKAFVRVFAHYQCGFRLLGSTGKIRIESWKSPGIWFDLTSTNPGPRELVILA